jgi:hypothetical protein
MWAVSQLNSWWEEAKINHGGTGRAKMTWYIDYYSEMPQKMLLCKDQPRDYPNK